MIATFVMGLSRPTVIDPSTIREAGRSRTLERAILVGKAYLAFR